MKKKLILRIVLLVACSVAGIICITYIQNQHNKEEIDKCVLYFNPVIPLEINSQSVIQEIEQAIQGLHLVECKEEITSEGAVIVEFYKGESVRRVSISGNYVFLDDCQYKGKEEEIIDLLDLLEEARDKR